MGIHPPLEQQASEVVAGGRVLLAWVAQGHEDPGRPRRRGLPFVLTPEECPHTGSVSQETAGGRKKSAARRPRSEWTIQSRHIFPEPLFNTPSG